MSAENNSAELSAKRVVLQRMLEKVLPLVGQLNSDEVNLLIALTALRDDCEAVADLAGGDPEYPDPCPSGAVFLPLYERAFDMAEDMFNKSEQNVIVKRFQEVGINLDRLFTVRKETHYTVTSPQI